MSKYPAWAMHLTFAWLKRAPPLVNKQRAYLCITHGVKRGEESEIRAELQEDDNFFDRPLTLRPLGGATSCDLVLTTNNTNTATEFGGHG